MTTQLHIVAVNPRDIVDLGKDCPESSKSIRPAYRRFRYTVTTDLTLEDSRIVQDTDHDLSKKKLQERINRKAANLIQPNVTASLDENGKYIGTCTRMSTITFLEAAERVQSKVTEPVANSTTENPIMSITKPTVSAQADYKREDERRAKMDKAVAESKAKAAKKLADIKAIRAHAEEAEANAEGDIITAHKNNMAESEANRKRIMAARPQEAHEELERACAADDAEEKKQEALDAEWNDAAREPKVNAPVVLMYRGVKYKYYPRNGGLSTLDTTYSQSGSIQGSQDDIKRHIDLFHTIPADEAEAKFMVMLKAKYGEDEPRHHYAKEDPEATAKAANDEIEQAQHAEQPAPEPTYIVNGEHEFAKVMDAFRYVQSLPYGIPWIISYAGRKVATSKVKLH